MHSLENVLRCSDIGGLLDFLETLKCRQTATSVWVTQDGELMLEEEEGSICVRDGVRFNNPGKGVLKWSIPRAAKMAAEIFDKKSRSAAERRYALGEFIDDSIKKVADDRQW